MKLGHYLFRLAALHVVFSVVCSLLLSQETSRSRPVPPNITSYPNTAEGLQAVLSELLQVAKDREQTKLQSRIVGMEIPNYEDWFIGTFGKETGEKRATAYGRLLRTAEMQFEMLWSELANEDGVISVVKVDTTKKYGTLSRPLDEYAANWTKTGRSAGPDQQSIGLFYFVDGGFRLNGSSRDVRVLSSSRSGPLVPAKLISRVQPLYPEEARSKRVEGVVAINAIVTKDGAVEVQNVGAGDPLLAPAAVTAVRQWRYEPTTIDGEPVDVQVKLYVTFALAK